MLQESKEEPRKLCVSNAIAGPFKLTVPKIPICLLLQHHLIPAWKLSSSLTSNDTAFIRYQEILGKEI